MQDTTLDNEQGEAHDPSILPHNIPEVELNRLFPGAVASKPLWDEWYPDANGVFGPLCSDRCVANNTCIVGNSSCNMVDASVDSLDVVNKRRVLNAALQQQQQQ